MQDRGIRTRAQIKDAAITSFLADGVEAASVDDICRNAGVTKGAFYHHFDAKDDVLRELAADAGAAIAAHVGARVPDETVTTAALLDDLVVQFERSISSIRPDVARRMVVELVNVPRVARRRPDLRDAITDILQRGIDRGEVAPAVDAAEAAAMLLGGGLITVLDTVDDVHPAPPVGSADPTGPTDGASEPSRLLDCLRGRLAIAWRGLATPE